MFLFELLTFMYRGYVYEAGLVKVSQVLNNLPLKLTLKTALLLLPRPSCISSFGAEIYFFDSIFYDYVVTEIIF